MDEEREKVVITLENPTLCFFCRFGSVAIVTMKDDTIQHMRYCKRLDCDNWQTEQTEAINNIEEV